MREGNEKTINLIVKGGIAKKKKCLRKSARTLKETDLRSFTHYKIT